MGVVLYSQSLPPEVLIAFQIGLTQRPVIRSLLFEKLEKAKVSPGEEGTWKSKCLGQNFPDLDNDKNQGVTEVIGYY